MVPNRLLRYAVNRMRRCALREEVPSSSFSPPFFLENVPPSAERAFVTHLAPDVAKKRRLDTRVGDDGKVSVGLELVELLKQQQ